MFLKTNNILLVDLGVQHMYIVNSAGPLQAWALGGRPPMALSQAWDPRLRRQARAAVSARLRLSQVVRVAKLPCRGS